MEENPIILRKCSSSKNEFCREEVELDSPSLFSCLWHCLIISNHWQVARLRTHLLLCFLVGGEWHMFARLNSLKRGLAIIRVKNVFGAVLLNRVRAVSHFRNTLKEWAQVWCPGLRSRQRQIKTTQQWKPVVQEGWFNTNVCQRLF